MHLAKGVQGKGNRATGPGSQGSKRPPAKNPFVGIFYVIRSPVIINYSRGSGRGRLIQ